MRESQSVPGEYVHGTKPLTRFERWERERTKCLPKFCMYAHACVAVATAAGDHPRFVSKTGCFRYRLPEHRPPAALSRFAVQILGRIRGGR